MRSGPSSAATSRTTSPVRSSTTMNSTHQPLGIRVKTPVASKPVQQRLVVDQQALDISSLNLDAGEAPEAVDEPPPKMSLAREKVLEEARKALEDTTKKKAVSLVVIGASSSYI